MVKSKEPTPAVATVEPELEDYTFLGTFPSRDLPGAGNFQLALVQDRQIKDQSCWFLRQDTEPRALLTLTQGKEIEEKNDLFTNRESLNQPGHT